MDLSGFEPETPALQGQCSTTELQAPLNRDIVKSFINFFKKRR